jgi:hypothetical protein
MGWDDAAINGTPILEVDILAATSRLFTSASNSLGKTPAARFVTYGQNA